MKITESHDVIIEKHPYYESLNKRLMEDYYRADYDTNTPGNASGKHSDFRTKSPNIDVVNSWIISLINRHNPFLSYVKIDLINLDNWFVGYDEGDVCKSHDHIPSLYSWSYYINAPEGSAPLIFTTSDKKVKTETGMAIIFPSSVRHYVPKNNCCDRMVLVGNVSPSPLSKYYL